MRIAAVRLQAYRLPLVAAWTSALGGFTAREGWLLRIDSEDGRSGFGDCAPLPGLVGESSAVAGQALERWREQLPAQSLADALAGLQQTPLAAQAPAACAAVECALLDLLAQAAGLSLRGWLARNSASHPAPELTDSVAVNATLGALAHLSDTALAAGISDAITKGYRVFKLKVGVAAATAEASRLRSLAALLPADCRLRLDANGAWDECCAEHFIEACAGMPIDSLEEPLADSADQAAFLATLRRLQDRATFPLAIDESWPRLADAAESFFSAPPVLRLIVKPPRHSGLLPALALARSAAASGMDVVVTSSVDSACGVLAAAQLAAVIDAERRTRGSAALTHGLATSPWLASDTGAAPVLAEGRLFLPAAHGLGFQPLDTFFA
ncbi:enolase C-terminal domain-like protein [Rhodocyclus tenuis]|uniref:enolase C-terminal domain-like protein n=1 Tax=Rhodocyclus tenuis TaxID=1066 RepID=UPI00190629E7